MHLDHEKQFIREQKVFHNAAYNFFKDQVFGRMESDRRDSYNLLVI